MDMTHDQDKFALALASRAHKENARNILTRSQARLKDATDRKNKSEGEARDITIAYNKNLDALRDLKEIILTQEENMADLRAELRADIEMIHQLEMDGVFLPDPDQKS